MELETVRIVSPVSDDNPQGFIIINKDDLQPEHVLFSDAPVKRGPGRPPKSASPVSAALEAVPAKTEG